MDGVNNNIHISLHVAGDKHHDRNITTTANRHRYSVTTSVGGVVIQQAFHDHCTTRRLTHVNYFIVVVIIIIWIIIGGPITLVGPLIEARCIYR